MIFLYDFLLTSLLLSSEYTTKYNPYPGISLPMVAASPRSTSPPAPSARRIWNKQSSSEEKVPCTFACMRILILSIGLTKKLVMKPEIAAASVKLTSADVDDGDDEWKGDDGDVNASSAQALEEKATALMIDCPNITPDTPP